jgi:hypothetical protein
MCYGGIQEEGCIKNAIIIEVPAIPHSLVWLNCRGQGYRDDVSIDATLPHDKGINRQCLCCRRCDRTQHESKGRDPDILKPSILFHNLSCSYLVMWKVGLGEHRAPLYLAFPVHILFHNFAPVLLC